MEVEVISKETIKPSSPTPFQKKTFKLSLMDKIAPLHYINFICYFAPNQTKEFQNLNQTLKESLSKTLTIFYPFAGRVNDNLTIDCNDNGVLFTTTHVNCKLIDLLASPKPKIESFDQFLPPLPPFCPNETDRPSIVAVQVNEFTCGGIAICFSFYHLFIDAMTNSMFVKCWSEFVARNERSTSSSIYPAVSMFPQGSEEPLPEGLSTLTMESSLLREGRGTIQRFVFEGWAILKLKENAKSERVHNPTRVEALTCFLWKHLMAASEAVWGYKQPSILSMPVDLRRRMTSHVILPEFSIGNVVWKSVAHYHQTTTIDSDTEVEKELVELVRESVNKVKDNFVPKLLRDGAYETIRESLEELKQTCSDTNLNPYSFTSWCKMGLADINFGWGKPIWISIIGGFDVHPLSKNIVLLMDGQTPDKIEAWVILDKQEMKVLENDPEFLTFTSPNPPILFI